ncbi:MAG: hypothetical protein ACXABV_12680 [Candidatus Thorarchaeota archaeon]|jgi:hypothetical protein
MMKRATGAKKTSPLTVGAITGIVALFAPVMIVFVSAQSFTVAAMTWLFHSGSIGAFGNFIFDINSLIASLPFTFLRIVFVWMIYRLYRGKTSLKRVAVMAIAAELQVPVIFLIQFLPMGLVYGGWPSLPLPIPIPLLALVGFLLTRIAPPPEDELWIEKEQTDYWWEETNQ